MGKTYGFDVSEIKYLLFAIIVVALLVFTILDPTLNSVISAQHTVVQFALLNIGLYLAFFFVGRAIISKKNVWKGALGAIVEFLAFDLILPDYHVTVAGLNPGALYGLSSSDYFFGWIYQSLGFAGMPLVVMTYGVTFVILFLGGAYLIKDFIHEIFG